MQTEEEIYQKLKTVLVDLFEIAPEKISRDAKLYQDLDIDSIDAIDLVLTLKDITGKKIEAEEFKHVRSVDDVVLALHRLLNPQA